MAQITTLDGALWMGWWSGNMKTGFALGLLNADMLRGNTESRRDARALRSRAGLVLGGWVC